MNAEFAGVGQADNGARADRVIAMAAVAAIALLIGVLPRDGDSSGMQVGVPPTAVNPQAAALMSDYNVSRQEATARIARQDAVGALATSLATRFPSAYGGLWIDHEQGGVVVAAVTKPGIARDSARKVGLVDVVREVMVERSLRDLDSIAAGVVRAARGVFVNAGLHISTSIDVRRNAVAVETFTAKAGYDRARRARFLREIKDVYGSAVVIRRDWSTGVYDDACVDTNCPPPLRGGIQIKGSKACSIGFVVTTTSGVPAVTTAGHCPPPSSTLYTHHRVTIGSTLVSQDSGDVDARSISVNNATYWAPDNWVLHQGFGDFPVNESFTVTSRAVKTDIVLGLYLCRTGFKSGTQCGEVNNINGRRSGNKPVFGISACAAGGDSGGAVYDYSSGKAYGQHIGSTSALCAGGETSYFSPIDSIEAALGVTVRTD